MRGRVDRGHLKRMVVRLALYEIQRDTIVYHIGNACVLQVVKLYLNGPSEIPPYFFPIFRDFHRVKMLFTGDECACHIVGKNIIVRIPTPIERYQIRHHHIGDGADAVAIVFCMVRTDPDCLCVQVYVA